MLSLIANSCHVHLMSLEGLLFSEEKKRSHGSGVEARYGVTNGRSG